MTNLSPNRWRGNAAMCKSQSEQEIQCSLLHQCGPVCCPAFLLCLVLLSSMQHQHNQKRCVDKPS